MSQFCRGVILGIANGTIDFDFPALERQINALGLVTVLHERVVELILGFEAFFDLLLRHLLRSFLLSR